MAHDKNDIVLAAKLTFQTPNPSPSNPILLTAQIAVIEQIRKPVFHVSFIDFF